jgi:CheY-like chemotaxis protein
MQFKLRPNAERMGALDFLRPYGVLRASQPQPLLPARLPLRQLLPATSWQSTRVMHDQTARPSAQPNSDWILVVDDDKLMLGLIEMLLKAQGWTVEVVASAKDALEKVDTARKPPAVLVCDVIMDGTDGLELTRTLRNRVQGLRAIVVSAHMNEVAYWPEDLNDCRFLSKPFHNEELVNAVKEALAG